MKRNMCIFLLALLVSFGSVNAQHENETPVECKNPKGAKGLVVNFNNLDLSKGVGDYKVNNFTLGLSGYYFFMDDIAICPGLNWVLDKNGKEPTQKSFDFSLGLRKWWCGSWFTGVWYEGITFNNIKNYENGMKIDFGYTYFLSSDIFIEPTLYWEKTFGEFNINKIGFGVSLGMCF